MGVVKTCTLTSFFKHFSMIFGHRRDSKFLRIYCKNEVILNSRVFHSHDATIQNSNEKASPNSLKINENWSKKRVQNQTPCREPFLEPFLVHFLSIWDPVWIRNGPFGAQRRQKSLPRGLLNTASIFHSFSCSVLDRPGGRGRRHPAPSDVCWLPSGLEAKPLIFEKTVLGVESQR